MLNNKTFILLFERVRKAISLSVILLVPLSAAELKVPSDYSSIQAAIDAAEPEDTVLVAPGRYTENLVISKDISVASTDGAEVTILDANLSRGVTIGPNGSFIGFTVTNARDSFGAGMRTHGSNSYIAHNIFEYNTQTSGGFGAAIAMNASSPIIDSNIFRYNTADNQHLSGAVTMVNSSSPLIINNIFHDNQCRAIAATVPTSSQPSVVNNTIVRNRVGIKADHRNTTPIATYRNNLIAYNETGVEFDGSTKVNNQIWENNLVYGNAVDYADGNNGNPSNISGDPLFIDEAGNDFRLQARSPAVDSGTNMTAPEYDFEGSFRPVDGDGDKVANVDIGAYELALGIHITVEGGTEQECIAPMGNQVLVSGIPFPADADITINEVYLNDSFVGHTLPMNLLLIPGKNTIYVKGSRSSGEMVEGESEISIVDTTAPLINIRFIDRRTHKEVTEFQPRFISKIIVDIDVTDNCDPHPESNSTMGTSIQTDEEVTLFGYKKRILFNAEELIVTTTAKDTAGNSQTVTKKLSYTSPKARREDK
ncbi:MAG: choice-of-anchor Q domain-containing protein [Opitutaceae bacterium]